MAKKSLGQNFILDLNLTAKIARAAGDMTGVNVIEVGPGPGGLTRAILGTNAKSLHAIERDDRCVAALQSLVVAADGRLTLHADDAMKANYETLCEAPRAIIANLPYNIGTVLLTGWLENIALFKSLTLMFQKEVAERIVAEPGSKEYGRLSIICQWLTVPEMRFDIPPEAFTPPPKITSTVVRFVPRPRTDDVPFDVMEKVTAAAFGQRRKMLRQSLKSLDGNTEALLQQAGIEGTQRAEQVDVAGFVRLAKAYLSR